MNDPLQQGGEQPQPPLFQPASKSTSHLAGERAALNVGSRRVKIIETIHEHGPLAIFEVAEKLGVLDHQISGRFGELERDGHLVKTGDRRRKPDTSCDAEVYDVRRDRPAQPDLVEVAGYPPTLVLDGEMYDRQELLPREGYPGVPYGRRADAGGTRLIVRVEIIECPGCGRTLKPVPLPPEDKRRLLRCGAPACNRTWRASFVREPGGLQALALVMDHH